MATEAEKKHWEEQQRLVKEGLKKQIDDMQLISLNYCDLVCGDDPVEEITIKFRWLP
jgi:hypothetical protein